MAELAIDGEPCMACEQEFDPECLDEGYCEDCYDDQIATATAARLRRRIAELEGGLAGAIEAVESAYFYARPGAVEAMYRRTRERLLMLTLPRHIA